VVRRYGAESRRGITALTLWGGFASTVFVPLTQFLLDRIGWRGLFWIGILPALAIVYVRFFVKEPAVWVENRKQQREQKREVRAPLMRIFRRPLLGNTLTASWWMISGFVVYYSINALFATHLQKDLHFTPAQVAFPVAMTSLLRRRGPACSPATTTPAWPWRC